MSLPFPKQEHGPEDEDSDRSEMHSPPGRSSPPTKGQVIVTLLMLMTAVGVIALFMTPLRSVYFWPIAGGTGLAGIVAMLIPLGTRRS